MHLLELLQGMHVNNALNLINSSTYTTLEVKTAASENDELKLISALYRLAERLDPDHTIFRSSLHLMYMFLDGIYEYTDTLNPCTPCSLL
jgi:pyrroloquinoline quinone (PQQ) biosynthesis protein C